MICRTCGQSNDHLCSRCKPTCCRFWSRVTVGPRDECWEWNTYVGPKGYGLIKIGGKNRPGNRVAWELVNGSIPDGLCVCHRCDNRRCCNPSHLFLGTSQENSRDMVAKGRNNAPKGERQGRHKLTSLEVLEIRRLRADGWKERELADKHGVTVPAISNILTGRNWGHLLPLDGRATLLAQEHFVEEN